MHALIFDEDGQDAAEYGLLIAGVGLLVLAGASSLGANVHAWMGIIAARVSSFTGA